MATYATVTQLRAYADIVGGADPDLEKVLVRAERDVDDLLAPWPRLTSGLRFDPTLDDPVAPAIEPYQIEALQDAVCAQAEYRLEMGEEFFATHQYSESSGPDFTVKGKLPRYSPKLAGELNRSGLRISTARAAP